MVGNRFGPWLDAQLRERGMTQAELARKMETSTGAISSWIHGKRHPTPASCRSIAGILRLPVDVVLEAAGHRPPSRDDLPADVREVAALMEGLPEVHRTEIVAFARWRRERWQDGG